MTEKTLKRFECIFWYEGDHVSETDIEEAFKAFLLERGASLWSGWYGTWDVPVSDVQNNQQMMRSEAIQTSTGKVN